MPLPLLLAAATLAPSPDRPPGGADNRIAQLCRDVHFVAYSTAPPAAGHIEESMIWNPARRAYVIHGPILAQMLGNPGVSQIPGSPAEAAQMQYQLAVRSEPSRPIDRFCEYNFQERADCDAQGNITYTQSYTGCDLQTLTHTVRLTPDSAGTLPLLDIRFEDVQGVLTNPFYLSANSDLRLRIR
jgi:hypothetical protein